jgi:hypothetical protein
MSSTGPIPQPGANFWTQPMEFVRQQQEEMIKKLTLAQQEVAKQQTAQQQVAQPQAAQPQAALPVGMKTWPSPGMTTEALQARLNDQLTTMTTTLQRQHQALTEVLAKGDLSAAMAAVMIAQAQGATEQLRAEAQKIKAQVDSLSALHQQEMLKLQSLMNKSSEAASMASNITKSYQDMTNKIIHNMR